MLRHCEDLIRPCCILSREKWKEASVKELVVQEASSFDPERFTLSGPAVKLKPQQALSLGLVVHELATNAAKHAALSGEWAVLT